MIRKDNPYLEIFYAGKKKSEVTRLPYHKANVALGYVICITPRSGSTFLSYLLKENKFYGYPSEWFNYDGGAQALISMIGTTSFNQYLDHIWKNYSSETGIFGVELSYPQLKLLSEITPLENVLGENIRWFYLTRENIVAQAISLYIAKATGHYHSCMENPGNIRPVYNAEEIMKNLNHLLIQKKAFERYFEDREITPIRISYESMMMNKCATVALFRDALGIDSGKEIINSEVIKKISGDINLEFEEKFRREESAFVEDAFSGRIVRTYVMSRLRTIWLYVFRPFGSNRLYF